MPPGFGVAPQVSLSIIALVINLLIGAVISVVLSWHFRRFGRTLSNRAALARVFPLIVLTTVLVISVVKSSLALSLGPSRQVTHLTVSGPMAIGLTL